MSTLLPMYIYKETQLGLTDGLQPPNAVHCVYMLNISYAHYYLFIYALFLCFDAFCHWKQWDIVALNITKTWEKV